MTRMALRRFFCVAVALGSAWLPVQADAPALMRAVRPAMNDSVSHLTFAIDGPVRYFTSVAGPHLQIGFSHTRLSTAVRPGHQTFARGCVEALEIARQGGDSIHFNVTVRGKVRYRMLQPAGSGTLVLEIRGNGPLVAQTKKPAPAPVPARDVRKDPSPVESTAKPGSSLIDIPALARAQTQSERIAGPATVQEEVRKPVQSGQSSTSSMILSILLLGLTMAGGTALLLYLARREKPAVRVRPAPMAAAPAPRPMAVRPEPVREALERFDEKATELSSIAEGISGESADDPDETSYQLAKSFRRGKEEVMLAQRMHGGPGSTMTAQKIARVLPETATKIQRTSAARKLGVGRGEVDLAERLRNMGTTREVKEETT